MARGPPEGEDRMWAFLLLQRTASVSEEPTCPGARLTPAPPPTWYQPALPTSISSLSGWKPSLPEPWGLETELHQAIIYFEGTH